MTYEMLAADLPKHLCYDGYLTSGSDLSVIIWPPSRLGQGTRKRPLVGFRHGSSRNTGPLVRMSDFTSE